MTMIINKDTEDSAVPQNDKDLTEEVSEAGSEESPNTSDGWQREVRCPITGRRVVASRPGQRKVTSEEIYALLRAGDDDEDLREEGDGATSVETPATPDGWQRVVRCPITGRRVVAARPGERKVTSEEIYALLRAGDEE